MLVAPAPAAFISLSSVFIMKYVTLEKPMQLLEAPVSSIK